MNRGARQADEHGDFYQEGKISLTLIEYAVQKLAYMVANGDIQIYNEFSLQHELGIILRGLVTGSLVQFERNVSYFGLTKSEFVKKEIDIVVYDSPSKPQAAIELKFPQNGQHPEQMFKSCKDIVFIEQLKESGFDRAYFIVFADDRLVYEGGGDGIYPYFRSEKKLTGPIRKPTGSRDETVTIRGEYTLKWNEVYGSMKYAIVEAQ
ncbi:hypothetical protein [Shewanella benthica]|uniref:hypothetical protein n=1 Tax=Shewanella benthica TaxID=43661 RepID=UPI000DD443BD|nr:hypothetical protein [Shewanella benthica]